MTLSQQLITVCMVVLATLATRFLVFIFFPAGRQVPPFIHYLGKVLPTAIMGLLIVYALRTTDFTAAPYGFPEILSVLTVLALHLWRRNFLLSITLGTLLYMALVQGFFV